MENILFTRALNKLRPNKEYTLSGDDYSQIIFNDESVVNPTVEEIKKEIESQRKIYADELKQQQTAKAALLAKLGITAEEAVLLLS